MISLTFLNEIAANLSAFRGDGRNDVLFDVRDTGNYGGYRWVSTVEMLAKAEPTGLCMGMLLNEMIEATINGSNVALSRVLLENGFIEKLQGVLRIKSRLLEQIEEPMAAIMERINNALSVTSENLGKATTREVAICLRDAIYSIEGGLKLRWLACDDVGIQSATPLCGGVFQYKDIAEFSDALRNTLPWGGHLARIGVDHTAIGIKQPGRIAFLSSMSINHHGRGMFQERAYGQHMAEKLDLDTAAERYPDWVTANLGLSRTPVLTGRDTHTIDNLTKLPRNNLIWFAMLVEITSQRMAKASPEDVELAENIARALPASESVASQNLPMVIQSNWIASELTIEKALSDLLFTPWELKFFAPALKGLSAQTFLPFSDEPMTLNVETGQLKVFEKPLFGDDGRDKCYVNITPIHSDWVGTRKETERARKTIFDRNLAAYLLTWGNLKFTKAWEAQKEWFEEKLVANLIRGMESPCVQLVGADFNAYRGVHLYSQSAKHKMYNPRCYFNRKSLVTHVAHFAPQSDKDLIEILGLKSDEDLPEFLRGWTRTLSWTTSEIFASDIENPVQINDRWVFNNRKKNIFEATVCLNIKNLPLGLQKHFSEQLLTKSKARA